MSGPRDGRVIAANVIERVLADGAYAAAALDAELRRAPDLPERERAFATELSYGTLRYRAAIERELGRLAPRGIDRDRLVHVQLLVAGYQILVLDRVAPAGAANAAVTRVKAARGERVAGFVNALLRRLTASGVRLAERDASGLAPEWLRERLVRDVGESEAEALLGAGREAPAVGLRVTERGRGIAWLDELPRGRLAESARLLRGGGDARAREGYGDGAFVLQEEGAQFVGWALGAQPGERVLDACAGRGQKSAQLAERLGGSGELWVAELHDGKLRALRQEFERLKLPEPHAVAVDLAVGPASLPEAYFDRALVDAPCSGTGTLRRRPEIALRLGPEDPARLSELAERITRTVATRLRPGGRLVLAVCSVLREECEATAERLADVLEPVPFDAPEIGARFGQATSFRLLPLRDGTDGYFAASFRRRL